MAFTSVTTTEIAVGEPVKQSTLDKIRTNLDDLDTRITAADLAVAQPPIIFRINGNYGALGATNNLLKTTVNFNMTITGAFLVIDEAGSSGTTAVDIKVNFGGGAYTSIFTTTPSVAFGAGNDAISSNAVLNPSYVNITAGELIRLDLTSVQTNGKGFFVRLDYIKSV